VLANEFEVDDLLDWGFEKNDLDLDLWMPEPEPDPGAQIDRAEELRELWGVETGQLWRLGEHRLICGDCTDADVVARVMDGEKALLMVTDPPYGVSLGETNWNPKQEKPEKLENDELRGKEYQDFIKSSFSLWLQPGLSVYSWSAPLLEGAGMLATLNDIGIHIQGQIIWVKPSLVLGQADYQWRHEICWYGYVKGEKRCWNGGRNETTVWEEGRENDLPHPTQKPVGVMERAIKNSSNGGDLVVDPFLGSGTTLIACERLGRKCRAVEISPAYCAVAIQRWVDMTGGEPELVEPVIQVESGG
jgi:DNA modification methylase